MINVPKPSANPGSSPTSARVLIAVPVHNEAKYVRAVLSKILEQADAASTRPGTPFAVRVLVVDDGSTDATPQVLDELAQSGRIDVIRHATNLGYGQALIDAFDAADRGGNEWVITMDCDEQHEPAAIPRFLDEIARDQHDIISGSRYLDPDASDDAPPPERRAVNRAVTAELNDTLDLTLTDGFCGFKAHRVSAMRRLALTETGYAFPMQFWVQAAAHRLAIAEIPVRLIYVDLHRTFGNGLDQREARLAHYRCVMHRELARHTAMLANRTAGSPAQTSACMTNACVYDPACDTLR